MAQDSFLGAFQQGLPPWPLLAHHAAAASGTPFDALDQIQVPLLIGGGTGGALWDQDFVGMSSLLPPSPPSSLAAAATTAGVGGAHDDEAVLMEQLVAANRLGIISVPPSPPSPQYALHYSTTTVVGSPPSKPVAPGNAAADDAAFAERAAPRLSCFAAASSAGGGNKLSRVASSQALLLAELAAPSPPGGVTPRTSDGSSSDGGPSGRKRKTKTPANNGRSKAKDEAVVTTATAAKSLEAERRRPKKSKLSADDVDEDDDEPNNPAAAGEPWHRNGNGKEAEPPSKDYIHVRARRGQATDSHSLAERVRREKIGERMKLLQDIVPGCSKVTGKAVMLDEIINYVQSLQRQVEFLSMKLSTVDPRLEVDVDSSIIVQKDANHQSCGVPAPTTSLPQPAVYSMEGSDSAFRSYASPPAPAVQMISAVTTNAKGFEPPCAFDNHSIVRDNSLQGFQQNANPQIGNDPWEDDLQSLVQMGFRSNNT